MKCKTIFLLTILIVIIVLASVGAASAQNEIITFDDLSFSGVDEPIPSGYGGLQWSNFSVLNTTQIGYVSGYIYGMVSPNNVAFNGGGGPASLIGNGVFDLNSAYLTGAWDDGLHVEVQGFVGTTLIYDNTYIVNSESPTLIDFNYVGVDQVDFFTSGGTSEGYGGGGGEIVMDNLSITIVPEPSTFALAGLAAIVLALRRLSNYE
jgi:hypothetical protein